jgi:hypothetical protein
MSAGCGVRLPEEACEIEPLGLPVVDGGILVEPVGPTDEIVELGDAKLGHHGAHFLGNKEEEVDDVLGRTLEALAQHRVLRGDAHRAGVEVAFAHHDAAGGDQRCGGEAELVGPQQRANDHIAAGAQAAIDLQRDARAQTIGDERLLGFGKPEFPWRTGMFDGGERGRPVPPS